MAVWLLAAGANILHPSIRGGIELVEAAPETRQYRYSKDKDALIVRMRRLEGQARGIQRMIDEDRYCPDIIQQLTALSHAADQVTLILLQDHVEGCVTECIQEGHGTEMIAELMTLIRRTLRS
jgi:CsoR family transcriptional regulator, copper-sensing transcriptional repressor